MSFIEDQFLSLTTHHTPYSAIDPAAALKDSASGKVVFVTGASQGIGQATAVAFARAGAAAVYITARSAQSLEKTKRTVLKANRNTQCE
jgi:NADPH:quinone reductase-like Zn-dependent oxidoreductase